MDDSDIVSKLDEVMSRIGSLEAFVSSMVGGESASFADDAIEEPAMPIGEEFVSSDDTPFSLAKDDEGKKIVNCRFQVGRKFYKIADRQIGEKPEGLWVLHVPHDEIDYASIRKVQSVQNTDQYTEIPLYEFDDGLVKIDYRKVPVVPLYE